MDFSTAPARTEMVFNEIVKAAGQKRTITYGEIARAVGLPAQFMANQLWFIRDACRNRDFPWLTVIVVNTGTRMPSEGIVKDAPEAPDDISDPKFPTWYRDMRDRVFETDWSTF